jgi:hypothetical protein
MPAPKTLADHVQARTFRSRRHHPLLNGPVLPWPELASIQGEYAAATSEPQRRAVGVAFERAVRALEEAAAAESEESRELERLLATPPVPDCLNDDEAAVARYWRAMAAAKIIDFGGTRCDAAAQLQLAPSTVSRDLRWLEDFDFGFGGWWRPLHTYAQR